MSMPKAASSTVLKRFVKDLILSNDQVKFGMEDKEGMNLYVAGDDRDGGALLGDGSCQLHVLQQGLHGGVRNEVSAMFI